MQFCDADFYQLSVEAPIRVALTLGELDDALKNLDGYGLYLRAFDPATGTVHPEPELQMETVLTLQLTVSSDLEPVWSLFSERAAAQSQTRILSWAERMRLTCSRLGASADHNLSWRRGSILSRLADERTEASGQLAQAARDARAAFGETAKKQVPQTLAIVKQAATDLGIPVGEVTALLDSQSINLSGGTICLHNGDGVPLKGLGLGSTRLLLTGLQRKAASQTSVILIDEIEHGLEPHRIMRLIGSLGAKESPPPLQVFMTTHSPVALRELAATQLYVLRRLPERHDIRSVGGHDHLQAALRACPEAFLSGSVIVCEGASEVGLLRGLDIWRTETGKASIFSLNCALADGHGDTTFRRAIAFAELGYRTLILRDDDKIPNADEVETFKSASGTTLTWREKRALEEELFASVPSEAVSQLIEEAVETVGEEVVDANIKSASNNSLNLAACLARVDAETRLVLGKAAKANSKTKKAGWFKSVTAMERVARRVVGPVLQSCDAEFTAKINHVFNWVADAPK